MSKLTTIGAIALVFALPLAVTAQAPPAGAPAASPVPDKGGVQMEIKQSEVPATKGRRPVLKPVPSPDTAAKDAEAVTAELQQRNQRRAEILRDQTQPKIRAPWNDRDITGGIQTRNLGGALGR